MAWRSTWSIRLSMADETINPATTLSQPPLRVMLLAYDGMNLLDLAGPLQALATANRGAGPGKPQRYETIVASSDGGPVMTSAGLPVVTVAVSSLDNMAVDTLIVPVDAGVRIMTWRQCSATS